MAPNRDVIARQEFYFLFIKKWFVLSIENRALKSIKETILGNCHVTYENCKRDHLSGQVGKGGLLNRPKAVVERDGGEGLSIFNYCGGQNLIQRYQGKILR